MEDQNFGIEPMDISPLDIQTIKLTNSEKGNTPVLSESGKKKMRKTDKELDLSDILLETEPLDPSLLKTKPLDIKSPMRLKSFKQKSPLYKSPPKKKKGKAKSPPKPLKKRAYEKVTPPRKNRGPENTGSNLPKDSTATKITNFREFLEQKKILPDGSKVISLVEAGENPGIFLLKNSTICSSFDNGEIVFKCRGSDCKGTYGEVLNVDFPNLNMSGRYVVKVPLNKKHLPGPCSSSGGDFRRTDGKGYTIIPRWNFLCTETISEFVISLLVAEILRKKISVNFIDTFYFAICKDRTPEQYMFMEEVNGSLKAAIAKRQLTHSEINSIYIQIVHAIATYQKIYRIAHSDLHTGNVFLSDTPRNLPSYFEYRINGRSIYIPKTPFIAKIADWGMAVKYGTPESERIIGNRLVIEGKYGNTMPNFWNKNYDLCLITANLYYGDTTNMFLAKILNWMTKGDELNVSWSMSTGTPRLSMLTTKLSHVTPEDLLMNEKLMGDYFVPKKDTVLLGEI